MKKEQLPVHIRSHCPEGLSEAQVEAWLLGYLARNSSSKHVSNEEELEVEDVQDVQLVDEETCKVSPSAKAPGESVQDKPLAKDRNSPIDDADGSSTDST